MQKVDWLTITQKGQVHSGTWKWYAIQCLLLPTQLLIVTGGVGKSCLTAQFVQNVWIESYDPTIEDSYRKTLNVDGRTVVLEM